MLDHAAIEKFVNGALVELGVDEADVSPDAALDDLEIDSLDMVELAQAIKKDLGIPVKPKDFDGLDTVGQVLGLCYEKAGLE
ncbi:acyl carrier protein [Streptomyces somaliensis]|uniref:Acyl carrier protein n=1 Tax=Streptomyces somaliensis (strain ATCC 33201 / DSM 40738 / JCM 12659 / KCTC 9044 / NCTC 11332 / NRRL B-12077 / IP 733) TaxID=1134445 RepID=A0AA44IDT8_STRE0|nr:acyl carrier protein [Streptomyces somaliensis]MCP9943751.1 acyl carrier protein [Streptomyces somaliensis]MCP9963000.1 acyl carrier protein [Streptomyces somaliensis]MCP9975848.1 acyl carrier protein [Streptomyces somaliensis]MCQ0025224.1 acyl carrier protein [Streptomyces somaliensis DSM 40738]NKY15070.1 acyl carrier protein [Streptomyces somaliensis DSM 40738]